MVSHEGRYVILKNPKCASTALHKSFYGSHPTVRIEAIDPTYARVAVIRHPLARLASLWAEKVRGQGLGVERLSYNRSDDRPVPGLEAGMAFADFVAHVEANLGENRHWVPQTQWLLVHGQLPTHPVLFEQLPRSWNDLRTDIPLLPSFPVERYRVTGVNYRNLYDHGLTMRVERMYADDLAWWESLRIAPAAKHRAEF